VDPCVLTARAEACPTGDGRRFEVDCATDRLLRLPSVEHLLIDRGEPVRLDVVEGTTIAGPVRLHFDLCDDDALEGRISAIRMLRGDRPVRRHAQLAHRLLSLHAADARDAGASLKEIAEIVLGPGDWPGAGDYRKSMARRLVAAGDRILRAGPRVVLKGGDGRQR
jgi:hypothetical protein